MASGSGRGVGMARMVAGVVLGCSLVVASLSPMEVEAQVDDPGLLRLEPKLGVGTWLGSGTLGGVAEYEAGSTTIDMTIDLYSNFFFEVRGPNNSDIEGEWDIVEPSWSQNVFNFSEGGSALFEGTYLGTGPVMGLPSKLRVNAVVEQTGTLTVGDNVYREDLSEELLMPIGIDITTAFCDEVYGDWEASWELLIEDYEWVPHFDGNWVAVRQSTEFEDEVEAGITMKALTDKLNETLDRWDDQKEGLRAHDRTETFTDEEFSEMMSMIREVERVLNQIRNLSQCDRVRYGEENLEYFESALMDSIGDVIASAAHFGELTALEIFRLGRAGERTGAFGPGANGAAEEALRLEAEEFLEQLTSPWEEGDKHGIGWSKDADDDVALLAFAGDSRGWVYHIHGYDVPASRIATLIVTGDA